MSDLDNTKCLKWTSVYYYSTNLTDDVDSEIIGASKVIKGTLFICETQNYCLPSIQWIPDGGGEINELRRLNSSAHGKLKKIYLICENLNYGPCEFREGTYGSFLAELSKYCEISHNNDDRTILEIRVRKQPLSSAYDIPSSFFQTNAAKLTSKIGHMLMTNTIYYKPPEVRFRSRDEEGYEYVDKVPPVFELKPIEYFSARRGSLVDSNVWKSHLSCDNVLTCVDELKEKIFMGGIESSLRPLAWKYLLGYFDWNKSHEENLKIREDMVKDYHRMKNTWKYMSVQQRIRWSKYVEWKVLIEKDVFRTDRKNPFYKDNKNKNLTKLYDILVTYLFYNQDLGYLQGMNDLLAIVMYVMDNEEDSFWCFVGLMDRMEKNFADDMQGLRAQFTDLFCLLEVLEYSFNNYLFENQSKDMPFCLKWFLIHFKREFSYNETMELWEAFWSCPFTNNFHMFFAVAILSQRKDQIINQQLDVNGILKFINDLSGKIDVHQTFNLAVRMFKQLDDAKDRLSKDLRRIVYGPSLCASPHLTGPQLIGSDPNNETHEWDLSTDEVVPDIITGVSDTNISSTISNNTNDLFTQISKLSYPNNTIVSESTPAINPHRSKSNVVRR